VHTVLLWGSPGPEIVHFAREGKFDALVMTRSTRGPLQKLGSVATYLVRNAQFLDLIIMRENEE
jgi:nucleotide-binding universal stress UspA family protein